MPDYMTLLANIGSQITPFIVMLQTFSFVIGIGFVISAFIEFWGIDNANAMKFIPGNARFSVAGGLVKLLLGGIMVAMGTLEMVGILSRTLTDDYANSRYLSYMPNGTSYAEQTLAAMSAILGLMQIIGFAAMMKGWLIVNKVVQGQGQGGYGMAAGFLLGGIILWNFKYFADLTNCSFGFNVIGMFAPYGMKNACN